MKRWGKITTRVRAIKSFFWKPKASVELRRVGEVGVLTLKGTFFRPSDAEATRAGVQELLLDMDTRAFILNLRDAVFLDKGAIRELLELLIEQEKSTRRVRIVNVKPVARTRWWHDEWDDRLFGQPYEDEVQALDAVRQEQA